MANLHIDYTQEGIDAIADGTGSFKLSGMKVSSDNSTWIDCDDLKWDGAVYSGRVTAPSDNYAISHVQVIFDTNSVLCQDDPSSPGTIATLAASGDTIAISFKPNAECKACVTNTPSGGGGGGSIDPAILDAKQDKALTSTSVYINGALQSTVEGSLEATSQAFFKLPTRSSIYIATSSDANDHYYLLADFSQLQTSTKTFIINGYIGDYVQGDLSQFQTTLFLVNDGQTDKQTIQGYYDKTLVGGCDILATSDQKIYIELNGTNKYIQLYTSIAPAQIQDPMTSSATPPDNVVSSMSANAINLSASGSNDDLIEINPLFLLGSGTLTVDTTTNNNNN